MSTWKADRFLVITENAPDTTAVMEENRPAHVARLQAIIQAEPDLMETGGTVLDADGVETGIIVVFQGTTREKVDEIMAADPYKKAGVWKTVTVHSYVNLIPFLKAPPATVPSS